MRSVRIAVLGGLGLALLSTSARADGLPKELNEVTPASSGSTDVAEEGFQQAAKKKKAKNASEASVSAGGLISAGNSQQMALTASGKMRLRRQAHQFSAAAAANFARAAAPDKVDQGMQTTVENLQGRLRYDYFFAKHWSAFLAVNARRDRFQQLDLRLNLDPGVAYYFIEEKKDQLWVEGGYDLQYDIRRDEALVGTTLSKTATRHSLRAFAGWDNKVNERVSFSTGIEYIQSVQKTQQWRMDWDAALTSNIAGNFSSAVTFTLRYDNAPLPDVKKTDLLTSFNLVYALM